MKLKLERDKVISGTEKGDLVGVYVKYPHFREDEQDNDGMKGVYHEVEDVLLGEFPPEQADKIISLWNEL